MPLRLVMTQAAPRLCFPSIAAQRRVPVVEVAYKTDGPAAPRLAIQDGTRPDQTRQTITLRTCTPGQPLSKVTPGSSDHKLPTPRRNISAHNLF